LNILLRIKPSLTQGEIVRRALDSGILITPVREFYAEKSNLPQHSEVLFEFGSLPEEDIEKVVKTLYMAWFPSR
jgi:DNA-binding transcriptional MocR family regulator